MKAPLEAACWEAKPCQQIAVCGVGARTPVGLSAAASAAAVRAAVSGLALHPVFKDRANEPISFAADPLLDCELPVEQRMRSMLVSAVQEAVGPGLVGPPGEVGACWLALPEPRAGLDPSLEARMGQWLAEELGLAPGAVRVLARGHAGGLMALQSAALALVRDEVEVALVVGVDSYHDRQTLHSLDLRRRLMSAENRGGFPPGEAAGACVLTCGERAGRCALPILGCLRAAATALEPNPLRASTPCLGHGLGAVLGAVTQGLRSQGELATDSYCDLNGERYRSEEFVYALLRTQDAFVDANDYAAPADCWGDVGAASGLLFLTLAAAAHARGHAKGRHAVLWAGSDGGYRSALLVSAAPDRAGEGAAR